MTDFVRNFLFFDDFWSMQRPLNHRTKNLPTVSFWLFPSWKASCIQKKPADLQLIANQPVFQFETGFFSASFLFQKTSSLNANRFR
ncbi:hypothetical protein [Ligilactobacillus ruminis]|uniref:hypothetical protein n=1 Tax=Ligilactobacillus ruminis TaxID=1623 RepID=UPI003F956BD9